MEQFFVFFLKCEKHLFQLLERTLLKMKHSGSREQFSALGLFIGGLGNSSCGVTGGGGGLKSIHMVAKGEAAGGE